MPNCLYCQHDNLTGADACDNCGMPLPAHADKAPQRRQRRFMWFCVGLTAFCLVMFFWLPRAIH